MESIDNMGKKSLEMLAKDNLTEEGKKDLVLCPNYWYVSID